MEQYILPPILKRLYRFCYKSTFLLFASYFVVSVVIIFLVPLGWFDLEELKQDQSFFAIVTYIFGGLIFICILSMASYAIGYVCYLWKSGYRGEAVKGVVTLLCLNILAGYIWFYQSEIKNHEIRFSLFRLS